MNLMTSTKATTTTMKTIQTMKTAAALAFTTILLGASAGAGTAHSAGVSGAAPAFERLKALVGTWKGKTDIGQGPIEITVQYRLLAAGSVLEERIFAGTPNEMVTMYYQKDGKLALTHYCVMGNRPGMILESSDSRTLKFAFDEHCGIDPAKESHMHSLAITFDDPDTITTTCTAYINGKEAEAHPTTLRRIDG